MGSNISILEQYRPVTHDLGLIHAPVGATVKALQAWHGEIGVNYSEQAIASSLKDALAALPPLSMSKRRRLFVPTKAGWTACFQSGIAGSDPSPAMSTLADRLGVLSMRVCSTFPDAKWSANMWEVYAPVSIGGVQPLLYRRSIYASNDGGRWVFGQSGDPFPFEQVDAYTRPKKRDRFNRDLLQAYLLQFGLAPFSEEFYSISESQPAIVLQEITRKNQVLQQEYSLEQVIQGAPWKCG